MRAEGFSFRFAGIWFRILFSGLADQKTIPKRRKSLLKKIVVKK